MLRLYAEPFIAATRALSDDAEILRRLVDEGKRGGESLFDAGDMPARLQDALERFGSTISTLPISSGTREAAARLASRVLGGDRGLTLAEARTLVDELHNHVTADLRSVVFLTVDVSRQTYYEQEKPPFGQEVADRFQEAAGDIAAAGRCLALDEWTACVFHCMRVLEAGLQTLAKRLGVKIGGYEEWQGIIQDIETAIKAREAPSKKLTPRQRDQNRWYAEMATNFRYFKVAWRNHVSHWKRQGMSYDKLQAAEVFNHTRSFMQVLAKGRAG